MHIDIHDESKNKITNLQQKVGFTTVSYWLNAIRIVTTNRGGALDTVS